MAKKVAATGPVEWPWSLPSNWQWERLGSFVSRGGTSVTPARTPDDVFQLYSVPSHPTGYPESIAGREIGSAKQTVAADDVLLCKINPRINRIWKVVDHGTGRLVASTEWIRFAPDGRVDPDYLRYFLMRQEVRDYLAMNASGVGGSLMRVRPSVVEPFPFPLAPMEQQRQIVARIDELFTEIDNGESALVRARDDLTTWRKALLKAAVTGELTADWRAANPSTQTGGELLARMLADRRERWDAEPHNKHKSYPEPVGATPADVPTLPTTWSWASIQQLATVVRGASPRPAGDPRYFGGDIPWITVGSLTKGNSKYLTSVDLFVTPLGREHSRYIEPGTLLFTNSGATLGVPKIAGIGGCINDGSVALLGLEEPVKSYVYHFLCTQTERLRGLNQGAAQPNLNTTIVKEIMVPVPPQSEMAQLVSVVESFLDETDAGEDDLLNLKSVPSQLRQSILAAAFRGDLT